MENSNIIDLKVDGMDCANCAAGITRYLNKQGLKKVFVNFASGEVQFSLADTPLHVQDVEKGIEGLGYRVVTEGDPEPWWTLKRKLLVSAFFTAPLFLQHLVMMLDIPYPAFFDNAIVQLLLCLPVYLIGVFHFEIFRVRDSNQSAKTF